MFADTDKKQSRKEANFTLWGKLLVSNLQCIRQNVISLLIKGLEAGNQEIHFLSEQHIYCLFMPKYAYPLTLKRSSGAEYLSSSEQHGLKYTALYFSRHT